MYVATARGEYRTVSVLGGASAISFLSNAHGALIEYRQTNEVLLIRDIMGAAQRSILVGERDGITRPIGVQISDDHRRVFVADSGSATITILDLDSGMLNHVSCGCAPPGLYRLRGAVFRWTEFSENPLLLVDGGREEPRILFVPPPR